MKKLPLYFIGVMVALFFIASCASIGNPSGGPRDEDPPRFVTSNPLQGAVDQSPKKVDLYFDELVTLKDAFSKVVVSPPSAQIPRVSSLGKRVTVEFRDTLLPNTTYTIDFGNAIADNNEGNQIENFMYTFSTGKVLDTLMVSGMVLGAEDLEPAKGIYVGLHTNLNDSAFTKTRFDRIAKTDENGKFVIGGLAPGQYRIFALDDRDGDLAWSSPDETLAFYDAIIEPASEQTVTTDTLFNLRTGEVDSVMQRTRTRFVPNNILLRSYNTGFKQQYITKYERIDSTRLNFIFNAASDSMPEVEIVTRNGGIPVSNIAITERSATNDTLSFWLRDPDIIASDTLRVAVKFFRADSLYNMVAVNDTLRMLTSRPKVKESKTKKTNKEISDTLPPPVPTIAIRQIVNRPEINTSIVLESPSPLVEFNPSMVHLEWKEDTIWHPVADFDVGQITFDILNPRRITITHPWEYQTQYKLTIDSLAGKDLYGVFTDDLKIDFAIRPESEYGSLQFNVSNVGSDTVARFVQLLDGQGNPIRTAHLEGGKVIFPYLLPGKYHARIVEDNNGNGKWDPGIFEQLIGPDLAYYYPQTIDLKANWSQEIDWNVFSTPVDKMKPEVLKSKGRN